MTAISSAILSPIRTLSVAGRTTPAAPVSPLKNASARGALPPESAISDWPGWRKSDAELMLDHGVSRGKIREARKRAGAPSLPRGRPRANATSVKPDTRKPRIVKITSRRARDEQTGEPASWETVLARLVDGDRAKKARSVTAQINALESLAAAAWRLADHLEQAQAA